MDPDNVVQALEEQVAAYRRLQKLSELQHEHVQQNQTEALLVVLSRRQEVLENVARLENAIRPAKKNWSEYVGAMDAACRIKAESLLAQTRRLLEEITAADRTDALVLQQRKISLSRQIHQTAGARQVNRNYAAAAYGRRPSKMDLTQ